MGYLQDDILKSLVYSAADVFVAPYLEDNCPNTHLEASACGVPTIGFNIGGVSELIRNNGIGFLAELRDSSGLAQIICYCFYNQKKIKEMGKCARRMVEQEYSIERIAKQHINLYEKLWS